MLDLHEYMVARSHIVVNHDGLGGTAPDAMTLDKGRSLKDRLRRVTINVDLASPPWVLKLLEKLLGLSLSWFHNSEGCGSLALLCHYSVGVYGFFNSLH